MSNRSILPAFEIIIQHFSGNTLWQSQEEIYDSVREIYYRVNAYVEPVPTEDCVKKTLCYLNHFGLVENPERRCWRIKSVDDMCDRLRLVYNRNIGTDHQCLTISIAFEIIIQHFSGDTDPQSTTDIKECVLRVYENRGGLPRYTVRAVPHTLRFLKYFGFAEGYWRIKSVGDMCARLRALDQQ